MIIWQGYGLLAIIIPLICYWILDALFGSHNNLIYIGNIISGVILYQLGNYLHNPDTNETVLYDKSGNPYKLLKHVDTFFFIKIEYIGLILIIIGFYNALNQ